MKQFMILLIFFVALTTNAQINGINYKAVIKDNLGNVFANQNITIQFTVLKGAALTNVFQQTHTPTTDANGIIIITIGSNNDFASINWGSDEHFLNVKIDTGSGLTNMGTTQFRTVPYALNAANVNGLEAIDEGNGIGWRLIGKPPSLYENIGEGGVDLSSQYSYTVPLSGASGLRSFATGYQTAASGEYATAMGHTTNASGDYSFTTGNHSEASGFNAIAMGYYPEATGNYSTALGNWSIASGSYSTVLGNSTLASGSNSIAMGYYSEASGNYSTAMGNNTKAEGNASTAIGRFNIGGGNANSWNETDPLFEIGNGVDDTNRSNALTILKNGTITAPSFDLAEITDDKALITKEYADAYLVGSDIEALDDLTDAKTVTRSIYIGDGSGEDDDGNDNQNTALGYDALLNSIDGLQNVAIGEAALRYNTSGNRNTAIGQSTMRLNGTGSNNTAIGEEALYYNETGSGNVAIGQEAGRNELGSNKLYIDNSNTAFPLIWGDFTDGFEKVRINGNLEASSVNTGIVPTLNLIHEGTTGARINFSNTDTTNGNVWTFYGDTNDTDANSVFNLFHTNTGNILQVKGDGQVGVNGSPNTEFHVYHGASAASSGFQLSNTGSNTNFWRMYVNNGSGHLHLYSKSQGTTSVGDFNDATGVYSSTSDRRLKKDFQPLPFSWQNFMKLETLSYLYKSQNNNKRSLGLVAQDVEAIYPELVTYNTEDDVYHMNYSGFGVVAIKAIQEQQKVITFQESRIEALEAKLVEKDEAYNTLSSRIENIETLLNTSNK